MRTSILAIAALAVLLSGCAGPVEPTIPETAPPGTLDDGQAILEPSALLGTWRVSDAEGMEPDTWLRLDDNVTVSFDCGNVGGNWAARDDAFLAQWDSYDAGCDFGTRNPVPWLTQATSYAAVDDALVLLDSVGDRVATLTVDGAPPHDDNGLDDPFTGDVEVDEYVRKVIEDGIPLPEEATPIASLAGRWVPSDKSEPTQAFVEFLDGGYFNTSDGCNHSSGRWALGASGSLISTAGAVTAMFCTDMRQVGGMIYDAVAVGMVGDELTFYDVKGVTLGALVRG
jgi:hypothetical protein